MPDYQKMYYALFNVVTDVIQELQEAQKKTEQMYIDSNDPSLTVINGSNNDENTPSA
jgi:hypothetical protein